MTIEITGAPGTPASDPPDVLQQGGVQMQDQAQHAGSDHRGTGGLRHCGPELAVYSEGDRAARRDEPEPAGQIVIVAAFRSSTASMGFGYMSRRCSLCFLRRRTARCRLDDACLRGSAAYSAHASQPACFASPTSASISTTLIAPSRL